MQISRFVYQPFLTQWPLLQYKNEELNCAPLITDLFLFYNERDFMLSLSDNNQTDVIEPFNSTSRNLDDLRNIDSPYFEQLVGQIYPTELQLNKTFIRY